MSRLMTYVCLDEHGIHYYRAPGSESVRRLHYAKQRGLIFSITHVEILNDHEVSDAGRFAFHAHNDNVVSYLNKMDSDSTFGLLPIRTQNRLEENKIYSLRMLLSYTYEELTKLTGSPRKVQASVETMLAFLDIDVEMGRQAAPDEAEKEASHE